MDEGNGINSRDIIDENQISNLLFKYSEDLAQEQMRENSILYLGRKNLSSKELSLIAISVSLAIGSKDSAFIHFQEARKYKITRTEIIDVVKVTKMILMSSSMSSFKTCLPVMQEKSRLGYNRKEVEKIVNKLKKELNLGLVPESLDTLSQFSFELFTEHLREKTELLTPMKLDMKFLYLIAFSVSMTLGFGECIRVYLSLFFENGGRMGEVEDAIAVTRFVVGNKAILSATEILKNMDNLPT
ncbi:MAG: carboxymuconolactone decarboxylase family protein [Thermoplasmatales archaeon]